MTPARAISAGFLAYRRRPGVEFPLVHPGRRGNLLEALEKLGLDPDQGDKALRGRLHPNKVSSDARN